MIGPMQTLIALTTLIGVITTYTSSQFGGRPLYCDRGEGLTYRDDLAFVALEVGEFESGRAHCGDWLRVTIAGRSF